MFVKSCCNLTKSVFALFDATAESVICSLILISLEKRFCNNDLQKKTSSSISKVYRDIFQKNLLAIFYRLPISLYEIEIYGLSVSPRAFLKLLIIVIALVQKGFSSPSLGIASGVARNFRKGKP